MNYKGVIFDFNGTLFFDNDKHILAWSKISQDIRNCDISEDELYSHINGVVNAKVVEYMLNGCATKEQIEKYSALKEVYYRQFCKEDQKNFHLVDGVTSYFDQLKKQHIPFTIASASIWDNIDFFITSFHLNQWIDVKNIVYDDGHFENKVTMFQAAAKRIGVDIKDCLIFEDSQSGIKSAYEAGCRNIIVVNSANQKEVYQKMKGVIQVIDDFTQMK